MKGSDDGMNVLHVFFTFTLFINLICAYPTLFYWRFSGLVS